MKNNVGRYILNLLIITIFAGVLGYVTLVILSIVFGKNVVTAHHFLTGILAASFTIIIQVFYNLSYDSVEYENSELLEKCLESTIKKWATKSVKCIDGSIIYNLKILKTICPSKLSIRYQDDYCMITAPMFVINLIKRKMKN